MTPTLEGDVLAALVYRRAVESTAGQLQYLIGRHSTQGIRLALQRLHEQGVLAVRVVGQSHYYRLNTDHLAAPAIIALGTARRRLAKRLAAHLKRWPEPPVYAALFGVAVHGVTTPTDRIGLFVACPGDSAPPWLDERIALLTASIRAWTGNDAELVVVSERDAPQQVQQLPDLRSRTRSVLILGWPSWVERQLQVVPLG